MNRASWMLAACLVVLSVVQAPPSLAARAERPPNARDRSASRDWVERLHGVDEDLHAARWAPAGETCNALLHEMEDHIQGGPGAAPLLGMTVLFRAIAEANLGALDDALWDWSAAGNLHPALRATDLSAYGAAAAAFANHPPAGTPINEREAATDRRQGRVRPVDPAQEGTVLTKPEKLSADPPRYPKALQRDCQPGKVVVYTILDESGRIAPDFKVTEASSPVMELMTLDAIRHWRFKPAMSDGRPIKIYYSLTTTFATSGCVPPHL